MKVNNKEDLLRELKDIKTPEAIALAYLINELIPEDRTTKRIFQKPSGV